MEDVDESDDRFNLLNSVISTQLQSDTVQNILATQRLGKSTGFANGSLRHSRLVKLLLFGMFSYNLFRFLEMPQYLQLYPPALDWIMQCIAQKTPEVSFCFLST